MNPERWRQLQDMVSQAADLPAGERARWLEGACSHDPDLHKQAEHMLRAYDTLDVGLEDAVGAAAAQLVGFPLYHPGNRIGAYRILSTLGQGGMGVVYRGERADRHFQQDVAIKVMRTSLGPADMLAARFRSERQILASMSHPNIARLVDGGVTEAGLPYLVMEYIDGIDLLSFAANRQLALGSRIDLFQQIASAVQYAHQNLIVHRDLKPSNILVTPEGEAKLLDFGIAKLLEPKFAELTLVETLAAERVMTLGYASPEQIRGERITTATDVYGLGLLLFEVLTGKPLHQLASLTRMEAERVICDEAPQAPSSLGLASEASPQSRISSDLDRIVQKALHKSPDRRYASVSAMLADVERFRTGFPVLARPDAYAYRMRRFLERHPWGVFSGISFLLVIVGFSVTLAFQAQKARHEAASADAVSEYLVSLFNDSQPDATQGRGVTAQQLLDQGTTRLNTDWKGEPLVKARLLSTLGSVYYQLGDFSKARDLLAQSKEIYGRDAGTHSAEIADLANSLGEAELDGGDYAASLKDYSQSVEIFGKTQPHSAALADAMDGLSGILWKLGRFHESEQYHLRSIAMASDVLGPDAPMTLVDKNNYAVLLVDMGRYGEAEAIHRKVLQTRLSIFGLNNSHTASSMCNLGVVLEEEGRYAEAKQLLEQSLHVRKTIYPGGHANIGVSLHYLSVYHLATGALDLAQLEGEQALAVAKQFHGQWSLDTSREEDNLGQIALALGRTAEARSRTERALAIRKEEDPSGVPEMSQSYDNLGMVLLAQSGPQAARPWLQKAFLMRSAFYGDKNVHTAQSQLHLGRALLLLHEPAQAAEAYRNAMRTLVQTFGPQPHPLTVEARAGMERALLDQQRNEAADTVSPAGLDASRAR